VFYKLAVLLMFRNKFWPPEQTTHGCTCPACIWVALRAHAGLQSPVVRAVQQILSDKTQPMPEALHGPWEEGVFCSSRVGRAGH